MTEMGDMWRLIHRELQEARARLEHVVQIRVSDEAIEGAPVAVPVTPERARVLGRLLAVRASPEASDAVVLPDPSYERLREIVVHPEDWRALLTAPHAALPGAVVVADGGTMYIFGVPVDRGPSVPPPS